MPNLSEKMIFLYERINFYNRYKELSNSFRSDERLKKVDKNLIIDFLEKLNYEVKYFTKEKFFQVKQSIDSYNFYYHLSPRNGLAEIILGTVDSKNNSIGGVIHGTCKLIEISKKEQTDGYIKMPAFSSHEELELILKESLSLYEDFKTGVLELQP